MGVMEHTKAETLAEKLRNPDKFTIGELTRIAGLFQVKARDLLALLADERGSVVTITHRTPTDSDLVVRMRAALR